MMIERSAAYSGSHVLFSQTLPICCTAATKRTRGAADVTQQDFFRPGLSLSMQARVRKQQKSIAGVRGVDAGRDRERRTSVQACLPQVQRFKQIALQPGACPPRRRHRSTCVSHEPLAGSGRRAHGPACGATVRCDSRYRPVGPPETGLPGAPYSSLAGRWEAPVGAQERDRGSGLHDARAQFLHAAHFARALAGLWTAQSEVPHWAYLPLQGAAAHRSEERV